MTLGLRLLVLFGIAALASSCATEKASEELRAITLMEGDSMTVGRDEVSVVIAPGRPNAGRYVTTSEPLFDPARAAFESFGKPGVKVWIRADEGNEIIKIGWSRTVG